MSLSNQCNNLVINELLCFLQCKIDVMDEISLVQICESNFKEADISIAKNILFEAANCRSTRKGDGKNKRLLSDIIKVLKKTEPASLPTFVAKDLYRLPPVTFDYVDVTSLLKDILVLKQSIHCVQTDYVKSSELFQIQQEIDNIKTIQHQQQNEQHNITAKFCNGSFSNNEAKRVATTSPLPQLASTTAHAPCSASPTPLPFLTPAQSGIAAPPTSPVRERAEPCPAPAPPLLPARSYAPDHVTPTADGTENAITTKPAELTRTNNNNQYTERTDTPLNTEELKGTNFEKVHLDDSYITILNKKKKNTYKSHKNYNQQGKAILNSSKIKIVPKLSYIYASRFDKNTTDNDICDFIKENGHTVEKVEKLVQYKETAFSSFKVTVNQDQESIFLSPEFWPRGVEYRKYTFKRKFLNELNNSRRNNNEN